MATPKTPPAEESPEQAHEQTAAAAAKGAVGEYLDETPRTYLWPDGPQTVVRGDVVALPDGWTAEGAFGATSKKPTRGRDNDPKQAEANAARQSKARTELHERLAKQQAAGAAGQE